METMGYELSHGREKQHAPLTHGEMAQVELFRDHSTYKADLIPFWDNNAFNLAYLFRSILGTCLSQTSYSASFVSLTTSVTFEQAMWLSIIALAFTSF